MYTCKTESFGNKPLLLCLCFSRGYVLGDWLGSVVGVVLGFNEGNELVFCINIWTSDRMQ